MNIRGEEIEFRVEERHYRVRGLGKNLSYNSLRINLRLVSDSRFHIDTLDLYNARQRTMFARTAASELGINYELIKHEVGCILLQLEALQTQNIEKASQPQKKEVVLSPQERAQAETLLRDPKLIERIAEDFQTCGLIGEVENSQITYLAYTSRMLDSPLALLIQALSGAGKTALMDAGLDFMPSEAVIKYTGVSGQCLFYVGENELSHKILAIAEDEGAQKAKYSLKIMQSEKELHMASTGKDPKSGRFVTHEYRVKGPAAIVLSSTAEEFDEELLNRFFVLTSNQSREQTRYIQKKQRERETLEDIFLERERERIRKRHQNAQRLLRPLLVVNPYAKYLTFTDSRLRTRRDNLKYLTLLRTIAYLCQYQREVKTRIFQDEKIEYIEVTLDDIEIGNRLVGHTLGTSLDELAPQTRKMLSLIEQYVSQYCEKNEVKQSKCLLTRREIREYTRWSNTEIKRHLDRLVDFEYLLQHRKGPGGRCVYQLSYKGEGKDGKRFLLGLVDVEKLRKQLDREELR